LSAAIDEHEVTQLGLLDEIRTLLEKVHDRLERAAEWGAIDAVQRLSWAAGQSAEFNERGTYKGVMVINETTADMTLGFTPGAGARAGQTGTITIPSRGWIVLPVRGTTISVGAAGAGSATVIVLAVSPQPAMGPAI
jgi:hypothetical protein